MLDNNFGKEVKVGVVFFFGLLILILGIYLGKGFKYTPDSELLKIIFPNSGGLQVGEPVVVNGVKRGSVMKVSNYDSKVMVFVKLDNYADLRKDATAKILLLEITGGKKVEIYPGYSSEPFDIKNNILIGTTPPDLSTLVASIGEVSGDLINLVKRLDTLTYSANKFFADDMILDNIKTTLSNTTEITNSLKIVISDNQNKLQNIVNNLNMISSDLKSLMQNNNNKLDNIINNADIILENAKNLSNKLDNTLLKADSLIVNINTLINDIKNSNGVASKLIYDKNFSEQLDSTFKELLFLVNLIKEHGVNVNLRLGTRP